MEETGGLDGQKNYRADLYCRGQLMCRIALAGSFPNGCAARGAVAERLKKWLEEYEARPHTGDSGFSIL